MALAEFGDGRAVALLQHLAGRFGRQDVADRGAVQAQGFGEGLAGDLEEGAALLHVAGDVAEVEVGQHPHPPVAVEDDEVEILEVGLEQLADREGDQRQLVDRRAVLLLRRAQDGEVDQVDRRVGLQDVAPGALARMRLARHQQHAQPVAHAVDHDGGAVVGLAQLAGQAFDREFEHGRPAMVEAEGHLGVAPDRQLQRLGGAGVLGRGHGGDGAGLALRQVVDPQGHGDVLADQAEARRLGDDDAAVDLVLAAGQQGVDWAEGGAGRRVGRHIVHLAVGNQDGAGQPPPRHIGRRRAQRLEQPGLVQRGVGALADGDEAGVEVGEGGQPGAQLGHGRIDPRRPVLDLVGGRAVDHHHRDVVDRVALLLDQRRVQQRGRQHGGGQGAPAQPRGAAPGADQEGQHGQSQQRPQDDPGQQG